MEFKMIKETNEMWSIHTIETGEVIASEAYDNFEDCARGYVNTLMEHGVDDDKIEQSIIDLFAIDEDIYTRFVLDLLAEHYQALEDMGL